MLTFPWIRFGFVVTTDETPSSLGSPSGANQWCAYVYQNISCTIMIYQNISCNHLKCHMYIYIHIYRIHLCIYIHVYIYIFLPLPLSFSTLCLPKSPFEAYGKSSFRHFLPGLLGPPPGFHHQGRNHQLQGDPMTCEGRFELDEGDKYIWGNFRKWWVKSPQIIHGLIGISISFIIHFNRDTPIFWNTQINTILKSSLFEGLLICSEPPPQKKKNTQGEHRISMIANLGTCFAEKSLNAKWWDFGIILGKLELPAAQRIRIADQIFSLFNIMHICIRQ